MFHWSQTHISSNTLLPSIYDTMLSMSEYSQHSEYSILLQPVVLRAYYPPSAVRIGDSGF